MTHIILKKGRDESLRRFHPWVFSGAIAALEGPEPAEGDIVDVRSAGGEILGCGHWQIGSISVRILSFGTATLPENFWTLRLGAALRARKALGLAGEGCLSATLTNCYRLVHGEGDGLPGLIVDWYDGVCVMQAHSAGMFKAREVIASALHEVYGDQLKAVYDKSSGTAPFKAGLDLCDGYLFKQDGYAPQEDSFVLENGHKFSVDWENGQKTGFFLDQRENRARVERYAAGKNVLNLFCYTGGFSVYALEGGAKSVDSVDSSARAMEMTDRNIVLNGYGTSQDPAADAIHHSYCCDALDFLHEAPEDKYDLMIVDPPAFAKHRGALHNALRAYQRLNADAIRKVAPGGIVFTFSCSQAVDKQAFALAVFSAAASTGRSVRILDRLNQPTDHPVSIYHPEGEYLKGLMLYVE
ncbi:MAG: class I SAM-dependent rRNA methyltransferase [Bacteroidales bacterium]|nr:class I SAM-dependent rRNA methyltransferase [Bacteroidales bacterium]